MKKIVVNDFDDYLKSISSIQKQGNQIVLYRGQSEDKMLLPNIARNDPKIDTTKMEKKMLEDFKRRSILLMDREIHTDWEWLVFAQHFELKTRLLDWSSNPLTALWFACQNKYKLKNPSFVYILQAEEDMLVDLTKNDSPFSIKNTRILRPSLNNVRVIAQSGWFTAHKYSSVDKQFTCLEKNSEINDKLTRIEIPAIAKIEILKKLSIFGVNNRTIFQDLTGLCKHLNWKYCD
jgi:hypothetical protein